MTPAFASMFKKVNAKVRFRQQTFGLGEAVSVGITIDRENWGHRTLAWIHARTVLNRVINYTRFCLDARNQFDRHLNSDDLQISHDYESVMHYPFNAFAADNSEPVIVPKKRRAKIGQNENLSILDVLRIQRAYHCKTIPDPKKILSDLEKNKEFDEEPQKIGNLACPFQAPKPLPVFEMGRVTVDECRGLNSPGCDVSSASADCAGAAIDVACGGSSLELSVVTSKISKLQADRPILFTIYDNQSTPEVFAPVSAQVIYLSLERCESVHTTQKLPGLHVPNLVHLRILECEMLMVRSQDFANNCLLRLIILEKVTFDSIEVGTFMNLPDLRYIAFDFRWSKPFSKEMDLSIMKLHCDCQYSWLRNWLKRNPQLIAPKTEGEIYRVGNFASGARNQTVTSVPVDCAHGDLNTTPLNLSQVSFSLNDPCL